MTYQPFDRVNQIHAHINKDGSLTQVAESLKCAHNSHSGHAAHIVKGVMADCHSATEECDYATQTK